jgi:cytochrome c oxidase subunit 1
VKVQLRKERNLMSAIATAAPARLPADVIPNYSVRSWLLTAPPRRVALLYLVLATVCALIGTLAAGLTRLELLTPQGDLMTAHTFGQLTSLQSVLLMLFFLMPGVAVVFGNALLPSMIGARSLAFPRVAMASWYVYLAGAVLVLGAALFGGVEAGWAHAVSSPQAVSTSSITALAGMFLACLALVMNGMNFLATMHSMRAPEMTWSRCPLFVWAWYGASLITVLAVPLFAMTLGLGILESVLALGMFDPAQGGDPTLLPLLVSYVATPAAFLVLLPVMGIVSEILAAFTRHPVVGQRMVGRCFIALAVLSLLAWGSLAPGGDVPGPFAVTLSLIGLLTLVPFFIVVGHWLATLRRGSITFDPPMLYALGFMVIGTVGMLAGLFLAPIGLGAYLRSTTFAVAQFQYLVLGGGLMGLLGGLHHWWPTLTGRSVPQGPARILAIVVILALQLTYLPLFALGQLGLPAGTHSYPPEFQVYQVLATAGSTLLAGALMCTLLVLAWTLTRKPARV